MINISRESEINLINILIDQDIISGKDLANIKKVSTEKQSSQLDAVFELKLTDEDKILDLLVKEQSLSVVDLSSIEITDEIKTVLPSNYVNINFIAPFKVEGNTLHIAISDSSKLSLMRNLKTITKKDIELHAAKISQISEFIEKLLKDGETTIQSIQQKNKEKIQTFDYEGDVNAEVLEEKPEEDIEALENESEVIK
jgi:GSPII_E N-terminal domain.